MTRFLQIPFKLPGMLVFLLFYMKEIVRSNLRVAFDVLTPRHRMRPGVVAIPLDAEGDLEISAVANLISMTPGSLSLDVSSDRRTLYVHIMYIDDRDSVVREIKSAIEGRVLEVFR